MHCEHNIPETKKGAGPCDIRWEVKKRNGMPNWWCRTHGLEASAPDGAALDRCSGEWFAPVPDEMQTAINLSHGEVAVWGVVPPAICIGEIPTEQGKVHVHQRREANGDKQLDGSFDIVRIRRGGTAVVVEGMAAQAYALTILANEQVQPLACPRCGEGHIDELQFATRPHIKHLCNACGRNFRDRSPSISNPLGDAQTRLDLPEPQPARQVSRPLNIVSSDHSGVAIWPSNRAIISTMSRPEDKGLHVHAWSHDGALEIDETYSPVTLDGEILDEELVRALAVQRILADSGNASIVALVCTACGHSIVSPTEGWLRPTTRHVCGACGAENRTRRRVFLNPLGRQGQLAA